MPRTQANWYGDTAHGQGLIWIPAICMPGVFSSGVISANLALTENATGDYSWNRTASGAETYLATVSLNGGLTRYFTSPNFVGSFQEQFGSGLGSAGSSAAESGWVPGAYGYPPFTGTNQFGPSGNPVASPNATIPGPPKGLQVNQVVAVYSVGVASLTSASLALKRTSYANAANKTVTALTLTTKSMTLTANTSTQDFVFVQNVTTPSFETLNPSQLSLEMSFVMASTGTFRLYGLGFQCSFNYS